MADRIPVKLHSTGTALAEFEPTDTIPILNGGTGATTSSQALLNLGAVDTTTFSDHLNASNVHLVISAINGQPHPTFLDVTRSKQLSLTMMNFLFSENQLGANDWVQIGLASDADSGYIMPFDCTIVGVTAHCENTVGNAKPFRYYKNTVDGGTFFTFTAGTNQTVVNESLNIDFNQGDRLRIRGNGGGVIRDTVITIQVRFRA